jgi:hypothetical protein
MISSAVTSFTQVYPNMNACFVGADFLAPSANNNPELSFVSDSTCIRSGSPDRCAWIAERSLGFKEVKRLPRRRHAELGAKFTEIVPEGDHLSGTGGQPDHRKV